MQEREKIIKKEILKNYCQMKRGSVLTELRAKLGDDATIKLIDNFSGKIIYIPNESSLGRATMPMLIRAELHALNPKSDEFKSAVRQLAEFYKTTQKAIVKMNKSGVYSR